MYKIHSYCRACGYGKPGAPGIKAAEPEKLVEVFDLGVQPLANDFCSPEMDMAGYAPLRVLFCPVCELGQLSVVVNPEILYRHYAYVTSPSQTMLKHFSTLKTIIDEYAPGSASVMEIGSNDGRFLKYLQGFAFNVLGVDPAENLASIANENGVKTHTGFFCSDWARKLPTSDVIIARHVFCHIDDWHDFVKGLEICAHDDTVIMIEVPYVKDMLMKAEFDTIYHEHLSYLSLKSIQKLLEKSSLYLSWIVKLEIHGGAILLIIKKRKPGIEIPNIIDNGIGLPNWNDFLLRATDNMSELKALVWGAKGEGKRIAALGASAKSTVWISACEFSRKHISFIADNTPQKQFMNSPGTDIPILDEGAIMRELPDYVIVFCWNFRDEVLSKFAEARRQGVKFIFPVPSIQVV